jgi:hypothetical protein
MSRTAEQPAQIIDKELSYDLEENLSILYGGPQSVFTV